MTEPNRVCVVLVDAALDRVHPALRGKHTVDGPSFATDIAGSSDGATAHGTWMAATILDLAPEAELVSIPVLTGTAGSEVGRLIDGLAAAIARTPDVICIGVGTTGHDRRDEVAALVNTAIAKGIRIVAADTEAGHASYPGALAGVDAVVVDPAVARQSPARRPHGARQAWFASPLPPAIGGALPDGLSAECLATANVAGFLARLRRR